MLRVSPFYDHYTIRIHASCHKKICLEFQKRMFAARVCISTGCPRWAGPPWDFGSSQALIPLCSAARFRSLLAPSRRPRRRLAVPGWHDSRRRRRTNRRSGAARPIASPLPGCAVVPTFPVRSGLRRAAPTKPTQFILR